MDKTREILDSELIKIKPSHDEVKSIHDTVAKFLDLIKSKLKKVNADILIGGSFAKNTLIRKRKYDIDFFVRFDYGKYKGKPERISEILGNILNYAIKIKDDIKSED